MSESTQDERPDQRRFGRYRVRNVLGTGAMGEVLLAYDELLGRDVAVKTLRPQAPALAENTLHDERLFREARTIAALGHPNIVRIFDMGVEGGVPYLVMEAVHGLTLKQRLEKGPLTAQEMRALGIQIARALDAAHGKGILHRDIKPSNLLEAEPSIWKLADFGIAHTPDSSLTLTGQFLGTPAYAAPESMLAGQFSPASDVYGLAATLYEAACGKTVSGPDSSSSLAQRLTTGVVPPGEIRPGVPRDLERAIMSALVLETDKRPSAAQFADMLARGTGRLTGQRGASRGTGGRSRAPLAIAALLVLGAAVAAGFYLGRSGSLPAGRGASAAGAERADRGAADLDTDRAQPAAAPVHSASAAAAAPAAPADAAPAAAAPAEPADAGPAATPAAAPARPSVPGLDQVKSLIAAHHRQSALRRLLGLRSKYPKDAEVRFLLGNLYFDKQWWKQGFDCYQRAIKNDPAYRKNPVLIRHAIQNLMSPSQYWRGERFLLHTIGKPAVPVLEQVIKSGPSYLRKRSRQVLGRLRRQH